MFKNIKAAVEAGRFAIPQADHAVVFGQWQQVGNLAAPNHGSGKVFIDAGFEYDVLRFQQRALPRQQ